MNSQMKRRMMVVGGIIIIVVIILAAVLGAGSTAKVITPSDAATNNYGDTKVQVSGTVVDNSYTVDEQGVLNFEVRDEGATSGPTLRVSFDKGVSATFGNGITAICTGRIDSNGVLQCTELVTKCPIKYENASDALSVGALLAYDKATMVGKTVKITGLVMDGSLKSATESVRLVLLDANKNTSINIVFGGALSDDITNGSSLVITGALQEDGSFLASEVALEA